MTRLMGLKFKIVYRKGKENMAVDALSRINHLFVLQAVSEVQPKWIQEVLNAYNTEDEAQKFLAALAIHSPNGMGFSLEQGIIKYHDKVWITHNSALQTKLISYFHASSIGGHSGSKATYQRLKQLLHWRGMKQDVDNFVKQCQVCQQAKHELTHPASLLQPLLIPQGAWQDLSMNFIEGFQIQKGVMLYWWWWICSQLHKV
jgi:hypothetical protein